MEELGPHVHYTGGLLHVVPGGTIGVKFLRRAEGGGGGGGGRVVGVAGEGSRSLALGPQSCE